MLRIFLAKLRALLTRSASDPAFGDEMQTHLGLLAQRFERQGMSPREAAAAARRQFGNSTLLQQRHREMRLFLSFSNLVRDLRFALRQLRKSPGFTLTAVLTLALSIGAATAIFSIVDGVLLKPLAYRNSGQLVVVWERVRFIQKLFPYIGPNPRHEQMWEKQSTAFNGLTLAQPGAVGVSLGNSTHPRFVGMFSVQQNFLDILGVEPALGRNFLPEEDTLGQNNVAIVSWSLWQSLFHGDAGAIGKSITVNSLPMTVVGVLPQGAYLPKANEISLIPKSVDLPATDIILPLAGGNYSDLSWNGDYGNFVAIGRLKPNVSIAQAQSQLDAIAHDITRQIPPNERGDDGDINTSLATYVQPLKEAIVGHTTRTLWLLFAAVLSVLLIACISLANAQIVRSIARERESAVRSALGASAWSLIQISFTEVTLLALTGGALGIVLAYLAVQRLPAYAHLALARTEAISLNPAVFALSVLLTVGAAIFFGLLPALRMLYVQPQQALQGIGRAAGSHRGNRLRRWLIGLQVFACTTLLLITGLFAKSFVGLITSDMGFSPAHVVIAEVDLAGDSFTSDKRLGFEDAVLDHLRTLPGVQSAGLVNAMLLNGESHIDGVGQPNKKQVLANYRYISPGYFSTLDQPILEGRELSNQDRTTKSAVLSETTAKAIYPNQDALGRQINHNGMLYTVVGIAADAHNTSLRATAPVNMVYLGYWDRPSTGNFFLIRSAQDTALFADEVRKAIWSYDPTVTIASVSSLDAHISDVLSPERMETTILAAFGGSALLLALLGIYGTLSYSVETRRQEIGIRMALGATRRNVYLGTLQEIILPIAAGLSLGWLASLGIGRSIASLLYGTAPTDAIVAIAVLCIFMLAAIAATFLPCRKATRIDPMEALRAE